MPEDLLRDIMRYEDGDLDYPEVVDLFQRLVDTGLAWQLQGHCGRMAVALIDAGEITRPKPANGQAQAETA